MPYLLRGCSLGKGETRRIVMALKRMHLADATLAYIEWLYDDRGLSPMYVEAYVNGREHGWSVSIGRLSQAEQCVFSEDRNSDRIVVYFGKKCEFSPQGNVPNAIAWERRKFYSCNNAMGAATYILEYLREDQE